jgi:hypothetical protein
MMQVSYPPQKVVSIPIDPHVVDDLHRLPITRITLELDVFNMLTPTLDESGRPFLPYILLMVDAKTGMIVGQEMFKPEPDLDSIFLRTPNAILTQCLKMLQKRPSTLRVSEEYLFNMLEPIFKPLGIKIVLREELPALDMAVTSLMGMFGRFDLL